MKTQKNKVINYYWRIYLQAKSRLCEAEHNQMEAQRMSFKYILEHNQVSPVLQARERNLVLLTAKAYINMMKAYDKYLAVKGAEVSPHE